MSLVGDSIGVFVAVEADRRFIVAITSGRGGKQFKGFQWVENSSCSWDVWIDVDSLGGIVDRWVVFGRLDKFREVDLETSDRLILVFVDLHTIGLLAVNDDIRVVPVLTSLTHEKSGKCDCVKLTKERRIVFPNYPAIRTFVRWAKQ